MLHTTAGDRWRHALRRPNGELPLRVRDLEAERAFWHDRAALGDIPLDPYAEVIFQRLAEIIEPYEVNSVLEIGPGWGNYTLPLCNRFGKITCVDVSPDNLEYLYRRTGGSIVPVCAPWEEARIPSHDLIFGYNCLYRLAEPELFLAKMDALANRLCVLGMNRPPELPWLPALKAEGIAIHDTRQGCEGLLAVLESLGIQARLEDIQNVRLYYYHSRDILLDRAEEFLLESVPRERLWAILRPFHEEAPDGTLTCAYSFTSQLLVWEPHRISPRFA